MEFVLLWLIMGVVVAVIANGKGFSGFGWFIYGLIIWPIALVHVLVSPPTSMHVEAEAIAAGGKKCMMCAEIVKSDALVCRFCNHMFDPTVVVKPLSVDAKVLRDQFG